MTAGTDSGENRRQSFRMNDTLTFSVRRLDEASYNDIVGDFDTYRLRYGLQSSLNNQKEMRQPELILIKRKYPEVGDYLEKLEAQIAQVAERIEDDFRSDKQATRLISQVNLSSTGIRFVSPVSIDEGQKLELCMTFSTNKLQVLVIAEAVRVETNESDEPSVSAKYIHIHPDDTEAIIHHLAKVQQQRLQARREELDSDDS